MLKQTIVNGFRVGLKVIAGSGAPYEVSRTKWGVKPIVRRYATLAQAEKDFAHFAKP